MTEFKTGDVVQLKSGGPKMTVEKAESPKSIYCQWFAGSKLEHGYFNKETLIKIEEDAEK